MSEPATKQMRTQLPRVLAPKVWAVVQLATGRVVVDTRSGGAPIFATEREALAEMVQWRAAAVVCVDVVVHSALPGGGEPTP